MLAEFASSPVGKLYGRSCERYGVDPGAVLDDDVMAFNLRVALGTQDSAEEDSPTVRGNPGLYEQMRDSRG